MDNSWSFCPGCGAKAGGDPRDDMGRDLFSQIFNQMKPGLDDFGQMDKMMDSMMRNMKALDLSPFFRSGARPMTSGGGFSVRIENSPGQKPKVSVQTFGSVPKDAVKIMQGSRPVQPPARSKAELKPEQKRPIQKPMHLPSVIEEPKTDVRSEAGKVMVSMELPGVDSREKVQICELESSVEVKAVSKDKAYFKILKKPEHSRIASSSFENGKLVLELS